MPARPEINARRRRRRSPGQASLDDLGTPLADTMFCVVDLETTGGSPDDDRICEIGAVKVRGGVCEGTFQTMVDPGRPVPPQITILTGITSSVVGAAPEVRSVLPSLLEFIGDAVIVAHNARFDLAFLNAALGRAGYDPLTNVVVDTCGLARRLVRDEVPNCRLDTLASALRLDHRPSHRALDDALAATDLLHALIERASAFGVFSLDDLIELPTAAAHPQAAKLRLTEGLPRSPGVYLFEDGQGRVLYVGKATDLRARVRSYFSSDSRRKVGGLLRETANITHIPTDSVLEAEIREIRLIHRLLPRYNRRGKRWASQTYLKLTAERYPRLSVVRRRRDDGATYLGPLSSTRVARTVADAIESALPIRRCTANPDRNDRTAPCAPAQLGVATCPCAGAIDVDEYRTIACSVATAMTTRPALVLDPLATRMAALARSERYEEAADLRDRASAFGQAVERTRALDGVRSAGLLVVHDGDHRVVLDHGLLVDRHPVGALPLGDRSPENDARAYANRARAHPASTGPSCIDPSGTVAASGTGSPPADPAHGGPTCTGSADADLLDKDSADERMLVHRWLTVNAGRLAVDSVSGVLASTYPRVDAPSSSRVSSRRVTERAGR